MMVFSIFSFSHNVFQKPFSSVVSTLNCEVKGQEKYYDEKKFLDNMSKTICFS